VDEVAAGIASDVASDVVADVVPGAARPAPDSG
jgi:hypothetical protein